MSRIPSTKKAQKRQRRRDPIQEAKNHGWQMGVYVFTKVIEDLYGPDAVKEVQKRMGELLDEWEHA